MNTLTPASDVQRLCAQITEGECLDYLLFYGHKQKRPDVVDQSCLSQWFEAPFSIGGECFATAEHSMMAAKARLFGDEEIRDQILLAESPGKAKALGRKVRAFVQETWNDARFDLVTRGNLAKFGQNAALERYLLGTGHRILVEASPGDKVWGIGMGRNHEDAENPPRWRGKNLLGFALMQARMRLRQRS